jgi:hypothetical protein
MRGVIVVVAALVAAVLSSFAAPDERGEKLDAYLKEDLDRDAGGFCGSALVAVDGKILLEKGYGPADAESGKVIGPDALGWVVKNLWGAKVAAHSGGVLGVAAYYARGLDEDFCVALAYSSEPKAPFEAVAGNLLRIAREK